METKQIYSIEVKKGDYVFTLLLPSGSSWGAALDAGHEILQELIKQAQLSVERAKPIKDQGE